MKLFKLERKDKVNGYDFYDEAVVAAESQSEARMIHPDGKRTGLDTFRTYAWVDKPHQIRVTYLGEARDKMPKGVVSSSFIHG